MIFYNAMHGTYTTGSVITGMPSDDMNIEHMQINFFALNNKMQYA